MQTYEEFMKDVELVRGELLRSRLVRSTLSSPKDLRVVMTGLASAKRCAGRDDSLRFE